MNYDLIVVGGGLAGSALALAMAEEGAEVLVLEVETHFRDRVRGEWLAPWGVAEAKALRIYDRMLSAGAHELRYISGNGAEATDLQETTRCRQPSLTFYHPAMQEALLQAAEQAGAHVQRGVSARLQLDNGTPYVETKISGRTTQLKARMVVGADGRNSLTRRAAGFVVQSDPDYLRVAGLLLDEMPAPDHAVLTWLDSWESVARGVYVLLFPQGGQRVRAYVSHLAEADYRLSGDAAISQFIDLFAQAGAPKSYFASARIAGPLASYLGRNMWVEYPYSQGVALIGDAAASPDPTHGQGLSLTLRDVRVLRDQLVNFADWHEAGAAYAEAHNGYYSTLHTYEGWFKQLMFTVGAEAAARRERAFAAWKADASNRLDVIMSGPDVTLDEAARSRYFGETQNSN